MKKIGFRYLLRDLWRYRFAAAAVILVCAAAFGFLGWKNAGAPAALTEEEQAEIEAFNSTVAGYETALADYEAGLKEQEAAAGTQEKQIAGSVLMKIDADAVQKATVQYAVKCGKDVTLSHVNQALLAYVKSGSLAEGIKDGERLGVSSWGEILSASTGGNVLTVTVSHYDEELASEILSLVREKLESRAEEIAGVQGEFTLELLDEAKAVKKDSAIAEEQSSRRTALRSLYSAKADLEVKITNQKKTLAEYQAKNMPEALEKQAAEPVSKKKNALVYAAFGLICGFLLSAVGVVFSWLFDERVRCAEDLRGTELNVFGTVRSKVFYPEAGRIVLDLRMLLEQYGKSGICLAVFGNEKASDAADGLKEALSAAGVPVFLPESSLQTEAELKQFLEAGSCLIVAEAGRTTFSMLEEQQKLCRRCQVILLGVILAD